MATHRICLAVKVGDWKVHRHHREVDNRGHFVLLVLVPREQVWVVHTRLELAVVHVLLPIVQAQLNQLEQYFQYFTIFVWGTTPGN